MTLNLRPSTAKAISELLLTTQAGLPSPPNYRLYRFESTVDWIDIEIQTASPTNAWTVQDRLGVPFVKALDDNPGGATTRFSVRFHDPKSWKHIRASLQEKGVILAGEPVVTGIELALDAYSKGATRDQMLDLVAHFCWFNTELTDENRRLSGAGKGNSMELGPYRRMRSNLVGRTIYAGDNRPCRGRPASRKSFRLYFKETDNTGTAIPQHEHRARIEKTLYEEELGRRTLAEWELIDFTAFAFKFRKLKPTADKLIVASLKVFPVGAYVPRKRRDGGGQKHSHRATAADRVLNAKAHDACRSLTKRMQR